MQEGFLPILEQLYGTKKEVLEAQKERYGKAVQKFTELYPDREEIRIFSAPGRTEIGGNHTDHQQQYVAVKRFQRSQ